MEFLFYSLVALLVLGVGLAIYERRKGRILLKHDFGPPPKQTELDREIMRGHDLLRRKGMDTPPTE